MLLGETPRKFRLDEVLIYDPGGYSIPSSSWTTLAEYTINASGNELLVYSYMLVSGYDSGQQARLLINDSLIIGGEIITTISSAVSHWGYFTLPSGQHNIKLQARRPGSTGRVDNILIRRFFFDDFARVYLRVSGQSTINIPQRKTCLGQFKFVPTYIICYAETTPTLTIDNVAQSWTSTVNLKYIWSGGLPPGPHTINVSAGYYCVISCPWLLPASDVEVFDINVPVGSTIYVSLADLALINISKTVALGRRIYIPISGGMALTPYVWSTSGTSYIVTGSYTFESFRPEDLPLVVNGLGGAIAYIGVDVRA